MMGFEEFDIDQLWEICEALAVMPTEGRTPEALERERKRLLEFGQAFDDLYWEFEKHRKRRAIESYDRVHLAERQVVQHKYFLRERDKEIDRLKAALRAKTWRFW